VHHLVNVAISLLAAFLIIAFVAWNINPASWTMIGRYMAVLIALPILLVLTLARMRP
jgi:hypothetical protein